MDVPFRRRCKAKVALTGEDCRQAPLREKEYCFWHDPESEEAAMEARRLGAQRAKREGSVAAAMQIDGLATMTDLRRILEVVLYDTLALQNGVPRNRLLVSLVQAGATVLKDGEFEERLNAIESVLGERIKKGARR
jgi:hypothetical protein